MNLQVHHNTPPRMVIDGRGLHVRQVEYLRTEVKTPILALISQHPHDAQGRLTAQWDPPATVIGRTSVTRHYLSSPDETDH